MATTKAKEKLMKKSIEKSPSTTTTKAMKQGFHFRRCWDW